MPIKIMNCKEFVLDLDEELVSSVADYLRIMNDRCVLKADEIQDTRGYCFFKIKDIENKDVNYK